jgi:hypothetical protein
MENWEWRIGNGELRMENWEWRIENGELGMGNGEWRMGNGEWGMCVVTYRFSLEDLTILRNIATNSSASASIDVATRCSKYSVSLNKFNQ